MRLFEDAWRRPDLPRGAVVTIGNFDGVHRGQRRLIERVRGRAGDRGAESMVVTFEPHPLKVLRPRAAPLALTTMEQKLGLLEESGVDLCAVIEFTSEFARTGAAEFVNDFLVERLSVAEVHVGSRFTFGRGREGSLDYLVERGAKLGFGAYGVAEVMYDGEAISSTRIRALVAEGRVEEAAELLGRGYAVVGRVEPGDARGRELGWPTANLAVANEIFPGDGVYATEVRIAGESDDRRSITNVGTRPTFEGDGRRSIECHLLDFDGDLYGRKLELRFRRRLRGERRFASPEELVRQIELDVAAAREYFAGSAC